MKRRMLLSLLGMLVLLASCNHHELCYHHPHTSKVRINVDWTQFSKEQPTGMTVMIFPASGEKPQTHLSNTLDHVSAQLEAGVYQTLVFNQSSTEFGSFTFRHMDSWENAEVVANTAASRWYEARVDGERVVTEPEWLGIDSESGLRVTEDMITLGGMHQQGEKRADSEYVISSLVPQNVIYTLYVKVNIPGGVYNLRSARAALDGLSEGVKFSTLQRSDAVVTQLLEEWSLTVDKNDPSRGYIEVSSQCFGLPFSYQGTPEENNFLLSLLLVDGKTVVDVPC